MSEDISLSEDRLLRILSEFKLDLLERLRNDLAGKADAVHVAEIAKRLDAIEQHGSRDAQEATAATRELDKRMDRVEAWRNRFAGVIGVLTLVLIPVALIVLKHYLP